MSMRSAATIVIIIAVFLCGCNKQPQKQVKEKSKPAPTLQVASRAISVKWLIPGTPSRVLWEATAKTGIGLNGGELGGDSSGRFEQVSCTLYDKGGKPVNKLQAAKVTADKDKYEVTCSGGVKAASMVNQVTLQADKAVWYAKKHMIVAEGHVRVYGEAFDVRGERMELNTDFTSMHLINP